MRRSLAVLALSAALARGAAGAQLPAPPRPEPSPQPRPSAVRVAVSPRLVSVDDGDTVSIRWSKDDVEIVRILGIDTPETRHVEHQ